MRVPSYYQPNSTYIKAESPEQASAQHRETMADNQTLPPIQMLLHQQDLLNVNDQMRLLSTTERVEEHNTLPPLHLRTPDVGHDAIRRLDQVSGHVDSRQHFHPYHHYNGHPSPVSDQGRCTPIRSSKRRSRRTRRAASKSQQQQDESDELDDRNAKAIREAGARKEQARSFAALSRVQRRLNRNLVHEWTILKKNNITKDIEDPLEYNKIHVLDSGVNMIEDLARIVERYRQHLQIEGNLEELQAVDLKYSKIGSSHLNCRSHL